MSIFNMPSQEEIEAEEDFILSEDYVKRCMESAEKLGFNNLKPEDFQQRQDALKAYYDRKREFFGRTKP